MTLPDDIELREELEIRLCINGCQQRTAGYNEAKQGKKGLDTDDMERMETIAVNEVMELIATYRKKWETEARVDELGNFLDVVVRHDKSRLDTNEWYKLNPKDVSSYYAKRLNELQGENK